MQRAFCLCFLALAPATGSAAGVSAPLTLLPSDTLGRCLDGTPSGFYYLPGTDSKKWTVTLFGGGECGDEASCKSRLSSDLGSSKYFAKSVSFDSGSHFANPDVAQNPGFGSWNHVQVPYCSQDLHMGTRTTAGSDTWGLYFSGHLALNATLAELDRLGLAGATDILLTGDSAGGIGTWPNLDWLASRYKGARVSGAPLAGMYFFSFPYTGPNHTSSILASFSPDGMDTLYALYQPFLNEGCVAAYTSRGASPSPCMLSNYSQPFVKSPVFVTEAQTDSVQLEDHDQIPPTDVKDAPELAYIAQWSANMTIALRDKLDVTNKRDGVFFPLVPSPPPPHPHPCTPP